MNRGVQFQGHRQVHGQMVAFQLDAEAEHQQSGKQHQGDGNQPPGRVEEKPDEGCDGSFADCFHCVSVRRLGEPSLSINDTNIDKKRKAIARTAYQAIT